MTKPWPADAVERRSIDSLIPYAKNSRTHSDEQVAQIAASMKEWGWTNPILIDETGSIIAGHGRVLAARKLGYTEAPVMLAEGWTKAQKAAYIIADNKLALNAGWDVDMLKLELGELESEGFALELTGFSADELKNLLIEETVGLTDEDAVPEVPETPVTVLGDVWIMGNHRLMCGDSTSIDAVDTLMDGQKADICFTSPPYNAANSPTEKNGSGKYLSGKQSDDRSLSEFRQLLDDFTTNSLTVCDYVFSNIQSLSNNKLALIEHVYNLREKYADVMIWKKGQGQPAMARRVLNSAFEYIYVFSNDATRAIGKKDFRGTIPNIFELSPNSGKEFASIHKATFRVELPLMFIDWFVESSVYEPFAGTGTTLIACEKRSKSCFAMELDPKYCDVIVKRWQEFTGKQATLEATGENFPSINNDVAENAYKAAA